MPEMIVVENPWGVMRQKFLALIYNGEWQRVAERGGADGQAITNVSCTRHNLNIVRPILQSVYGQQPQSQLLLADGHRAG